MRLIAVYAVFVLIGEALAYAIDRTVEHWSAPTSLPVFLACFFAVFWAVETGDPGGVSPRKFRGHTILASCAQPNSA
jgi:hypothetical protein